MNEDDEDDDHNDHDRHLLDGLGDAGVVESGGDGAVESLSVGLPLADVPGQRINLKFLYSINLDQEALLF